MEPDELNELLRQAVQDEDVVTINELCEAGADANVTTLYGDTLLHNYPPVEIVQLLCQYGADPNNPGKMDDTPWKCVVRLADTSTQDLQVWSDCGGRWCDDRGRFIMTFFNRDLDRVDRRQRAREAIDIARKARLAANIDDEVNDATLRFAVMATPYWLLVLQPRTASRVWKQWRQMCATLAFNELRLLYALPSSPDWPIAPSGEQAFVGAESLKLVLSLSWNREKVADVLLLRSGFGARNLFP